MTTVLLFIRVPKEAQDDALSNDTTGGRQTPTGRPTRGDKAPMTVLFLSLLGGRSKGYLRRT
jgi:hypothetical protein